MRNRRTIVAAILSLLLAFTTRAESCFPVPPGLVGWWKAETNATDQIGSNNGILLNGATFGAGEIGQAFSFITTNAGVKIPASSVLDVGLSNGFTVETWINPSTLSQRGEIAEWNNGDTNSTVAYGVHLQILSPGELGLGAGNLFADVHGINGATHWIMAPGGTLTTNIFQHVALTYDKTSGIARLYRNGLIVAQQNLGSFTPLTSYDFYIGRRPASIGSIHSFSGKIDETSVYNRALSSNDVMAIYIAGSSGKCDLTLPPSPSCLPAPSGIVGLWRAEGNGLDSVGTNNGVLENGLNFATAEVGRGFLITSTNSDLRIPASASLNVGASSGLTIEAWINPYNINLRSPIAEWNNGVGGWGVHLWVSPDYPGQLYANISSANGWHQITTEPGVISSNLFQHVAVTYDKTSGIARLYRNGQVVAQTSFGTFTPQTTFDLYLGRRASGAPGDTGTFIGIIDEISLYNRALNTNEVAAIYNAGTFGKCYTNHSPLAVTDAFTTPPNMPVSFSAAKLLLNDMDPDGDALTVISTSTNSTQGGTVSLAAGSVTYTPASGFTGNDLFTYMVSDSHGGSAVGNVLVTVGNGGTVSLNIVFGPINLGGSFLVQFAGIPGLTYTVEAASSLAGPWTKVANLTAPVINEGLGVGVFQFTEPVGSNTTRFYRTVFPAY